MTRKHFQAIAEALKATRPFDADRLDRWIQWGDVVKTLATTLSRFNGGFDVDCLFAACGFDPELHAGWSR